MGKSKLRVSPEKAERIKNICARHRDQYGDAAIKEDLLKFIDTDLKKKFFEPGLRARIGEAAFEKKKDLYESYRHSVANRSAKSIDRALNGEGVSRGAINLIEVFDLYIEQYDPTPGPPSSAHSLELQTAAPGSFSANTINLLKDRAISRCSFKDCPHPTSAPVMGNSSLSLSLGQAVCIYGVHPGQPRYNPSKPQQEDDINNAIWLCKYHATMVNEHNGKDYSPETLRKWKRAHEQLMHAWAQGRKRPFLELNLNEIQPELAAEILLFFDHRSLLFEPTAVIEKAAVTNLADAVKAFFKDWSYAIHDNGKIMQQVRIIVLAISVFFSEFIDTEDRESFEAGFSALRKLIGQVLAEMAAINKIELPSNLRKIAPST